MKFPRPRRASGLPVIVLLAVAGFVTAPGRASAQTVANRTTLPPMNPPNEISISAKVPTAYAAAGTPGSFLIQRVGSSLEGLTIHYQVSGQAVAGQDYVALEGTRTISADKDHATITVHPLVVAGRGGTVKGVRVTLLTGGRYSLGSEVKATVKIVQ